MARALSAYRIKALPAHAVDRQAIAKAMHEDSGV